MPYELYREDGSVTVTEPELWSWVAEYDDGSLQWQFDIDAARYYYFREIDQSRLKNFYMVHKDMALPPFKLIFPKGAELIHFYTNYVTPKTGEHIRLYGFGFKVGGNKSIIMIQPDGSGVLVDDSNSFKLMGEI